jgi:hypothetical protein
LQAVEGSGTSAQGIGIFKTIKFCTAKLIQYFEIKKYFHKKTKKNMVTFEITGLEELRDKLNSINLDDLTYRVAVELKHNVEKRVFVDGKASDGSQIGTYSPGYMKVRTGNYPETRVKKGVNKGNFREKKRKGQAGVFTKGKNKGQPRPVYNHTNDPKIILTLTGAMNEDFAGTPPQKTEKGYGIGFSNPDNYQKAMWQDDTKGKQRYKKPIWDLTKEEQQAAQEVVHNYLVNLGLV